MWQCDVFGKVLLNLTECHMTSCLNSDFYDAFTCKAKFLNWIKLDSFTCLWDYLILERKLNQQYRLFGRKGWNICWGNGSIVSHMMTDMKNCFLSLFTLPFIERWLGVPCISSGFMFHVHVDIIIKEIKRKCDSSVQN